MPTAQLGDHVRIQYSRLPQRAAARGVSHGQKTLEFTVGSREVFPTLSFGVIGMAPGERKQFTLQPHEAYGKIKRKLVRKIPRTRFPQQLVLRVGKRLTAVRGIAGRRRRVTVVEIRPDSVIVDGNHPLAGKVVELEVSLLSLDSSSNSNQQKPQFDLGGQG
jgi:peptidylprolyl isomerase